MNEFNPKIKITPEMFRGFKTIECDCGGKIFRAGFVFKKISALVSPTGREETYPVEVMVCDACGKVPTEFNENKVLPDEVLARRNIL